MWPINATHNERKWTLWCESGIFKLFITTPSTSSFRRGYKGMPLQQISTSLLFLPNPIDMYTQAYLYGISIHVYGRVASTHLIIRTDNLLFVIFYLGVLLGHLVAQQEIMYQRWEKNKKPWSNFAGRTFVYRDGKEGKTKDGTREIDNVWLCSFYSTYILLT